MTSHINNTSNALNRKSAAVYIIPTLHLRVLRVHPIHVYLYLRDLYMCLHIYIFRTDPQPKNHAISNSFCMNFLVQNMQKVKLILYL